MSQTIMVSPKAIEQILARLDALTKEVKVIKARLFESESSYGNEAWWEWSDKQALKSIKEGKGIAIRNKSELDDFFKSL